MPKVIVKVQVSLYSSDGQTDMMLYSEDHSIFDQIPADPDFVKLCMKGRPKAFFYARIDTKKQGYYLTDKEAPWQEW